MSSCLSEISKAGVSVWLDDLSRARLSNGSLSKLILEDKFPKLYANAVKKFVVP